MTYCYGLSISTALDATYVPRCLGKLVTPRRYSGIAILKLPRSLDLNPGFLTSNERHGVMTPLSISAPSRSKYDRIVTPPLRFRRGAVSDLIAESRVQSYLIVRV